MIKDDYTDPKSIASWAVNKYGDDALYMAEETHELTDLCGPDLTQKAIPIIRKTLEAKSKKAKGKTKVKSKKLPSKYRFHNTDPDEIRPVSRLSTVTKGNLEYLQDTLGINFNNEALVWKINVAGSRQYGRKASVRDDILIPGTLGSNTIEYWRHESGGFAAGQTLLYINGKRFQANDFKYLDRPSMVDEINKKMGYEFVKLQR